MGLCAKLFLAKDIVSHKMIKTSPLTGPAKTCRTSNF